MMAWLLSIWLLNIWFRFKLLLILQKKIDLTLTINLKLITLIDYSILLKMRIQNHLFSYFNKLKIFSPTFITNDISTLNWIQNSTRTNSKPSHPRQHSIFVTSLSTNIIKNTHKKNLLESRSKKKNCTKKVKENKQEN